MRIDVIFDTICPWCFIGKRRLDRALAQRPEIPVDLRWCPFLLNPDISEQGISRAAYLERKFGAASRMTRLFDSLREAGRCEGIDFNFDNIHITPNSLKAHQLVQVAAGIHKASDVVEALFSAYFCEGRNIGDGAVLADIGLACGLSSAGCSPLLEEKRGSNDTCLDTAQTHRLSISGIPCFIFGGCYGIAGAQESDILLRMLDIAAEAEAMQPLSSVDR